MTRFVLPLAIALSTGVPAVAQDTPSGRDRARVPFHIPSTSESLVLDGAIDDALWRTALALELRYEVRPGENTTPPVRTELFLAHDSGHLYVGFRCHDPNPSAIRARFTDRDSMFNDDWVGIVLDTFNDERRAYEFFANPLGVQGDMFLDDVADNEDDTWNAIWSSAGRITTSGYEVEFVIPLTQLRFKVTDGVQTWGVDGLRNYPRADRHQFTLFPRVRGENSYLGQEEKITGFAGITPGQNIELVPTFTTVRSDTRPTFPLGRLERERADGDVGLTAKWGITPNVTINGTVNPDFSQVEADSVQLDVNNQFALFFSETRPFFLEGADFFRTTRMNLVHTRQVAQPRGALKVSGKTGRHAFGLFSARDKTTGIVLPGNQRSRTEVLDQAAWATVGRYRLDMGANSTVGMMVTDRRGQGYSNQVWAFDALQRLTAADSISGTFAISSTTDADAIAAITSTSRTRDIAVDVQYSRSTRNWDAYVNYNDYEPEFRADLGFITQADRRRWETGVTRTWHGDSTRPYNSLRLWGNYDEAITAAGTLLEREFEGYFSFNGRRESYAQVGGGQRRRVSNGVYYDQMFFSASAEMRASAAVTFGASANTGDWIDFAHARPATEFGWRVWTNLDPGRHLSVRLSHAYSALDVAGGRLYRAHVPEARINYQFDARTLVRVVLQYTGLERDPALHAALVDRSSRDLFVQVLLSHKINAQTALYFGYASGANGADTYTLTQSARSLFAKVSYAWLR